MAIAEAQDAAMLQEAADDRFDVDVLRQALHAGAQAANAAHDQFDVNPGLACAVHRVDNDRIDQRIHLRPDIGGTAGLGVFRLRGDEFKQRRLQRDRRERDVF